MSNEADDILSFFDLSEEDRKNYNIVQDWFESYFGKKKNTIKENRKKENLSTTLYWTCTVYRSIVHTGLSVRRRLETV